jgi:hypothetical protein
VADVLIARTMHYLDQADLGHRRSAHGMRRFGHEEKRTLAAPTASRGATLCGSPACRLLVIGQNESLLAALLSQGLFLSAIAISRAMSLPPRSRRKPQSRTSVTAYNAALCFLARPEHCRLSDAERANPIQVVEAIRALMTTAARRGIEWMREHYRRPGSGATVLTRPREAGWHVANGCGKSFVD